MRALVSAALLLAVVVATPSVVLAQHYPTPPDNANLCVDQCSASANYCFARCEGLEACETHCEAVNRACVHECGGDKPQPPIIPDPANPDGDEHQLIPELSASSPAVKNYPGSGCQSDCQEAWNFCLESTDNPANCARIRNRCFAACRASPSSPSSPVKSVGMDMKCLASCSKDRAKCTGTPDQCNADYEVCEGTCGLRVQSKRDTVPTDCDQVYNQCYYECPRPNRDDMNYKPCEDKCMAAMNQCYGIPIPPAAAASVVSAAFDGPWSPCENACVATSDVCFARCTCQPVACEQRCFDAVGACTAQCRKGTSVAIATRAAFPHVFGVAPKPLALVVGSVTLNPNEDCFKACYAKGDAGCTAQCPCHGDGCLESCLQLTCTQQCSAPKPRRALAPTNDKPAPSADCLQQHKYCVEGCDSTYDWCVSHIGRIRQPVCTQEQSHCQMNCEINLNQLCPAGLPPLDPHTVTLASTSSRAVRLARRFNEARLGRA